jgi:ferredoxin
MKVIADKVQCVSAGMCTNVAPTVFGLDDDAIVELLVEAGEIDAGEEQAAVSQAIAVCPAQALRWQ